MQKRIAAAILGAVLLGSPVALSAQTVAELQQQIEALLSQLSVLQSKVIEASARPATSTQAASTPTVAPIGAGGCVAVARTLSLGSRGDDVSALQRFLARDASVYADGSVTGFYGPLTEAAVKAFQAKHGIASSGSPETTGFGAVGPRTRERIRSSTCTPGEAAASVASSGSAVPTCTIIASRNTVRGGESVKITWVSKNASYAIDNNTGKSTQLQGSVEYSPKESTTYMYSFFGSRPGTPAVCAMRVFVESPVAAAPPAAPVQENADALSISPAEGPAPLNANFTFRPKTGISCADRDLMIEYGDGIRDILTTGVCASSGIRTAFHVYRQNNIYDVRVYDNTSCSGNVKCGTSLEIAKAQVRVAGPASCTLGGSTVAHGETREFYNVSVVLPGESCAEKKVARTCTDGVLSGETSYQHASCTVVPQASCTLDGITIAHGSSRGFYNSGCGIQTRQCSNGVLSGSGAYDRAACSSSGATTSTTASCTLDGLSLPHGSSTRFYFAQHVPAAEDCSSYGQIRTCISGSLTGSGTYKYASCTPVSSNSCALDNVVVTSGQSAIFYRHSAPPAGELCTAHQLSRTCTSGTFGGDSAFVYANCANARSCAQDGLTLAHGSSSVFYGARTVPFGSTCAATSTSRTCTNGLLSGDSAYQYSSCSVHAPTASNSQYLASALTALEQAVKGILDILGR